MVDQSLKPDDVCLVGKVSELLAVDLGRGGRLDERQVRLEQIPERSVRLVQVMAGQETKDARSAP